MDTLADYENWKSKQQKSGVGAASVVLGSVEDAPDQIAGDLQIASEFGKVTGNPVPPAPMVKEYRSVFQQAIEKTRAETILSSSPRLTEWLRNPENAGLARDDLEGLSWWETTLGATGNSLKRAGLSVPQTYDQFMAGKFAGDAADLNKGFAEILAEEAPPIITKSGAKIESPIYSPGELIGAAVRWGTSRWSGLMADVGVMDDPAAEAAGYQMRAAEWQKKIAELPMSPGAQAVREKMGTVTGNWQEQLSKFGQIVAEDPAGFLSFLGQVSLESAPSIGVSAGVGVVTRSPKAAAATMGALSGAREYGSGAGDVLAQSGYDLTTPEGALAAISDEDLMRRAGEMGQTRALVIGALDGLSGGIAGKVLAQNPAGNMVLQSLTQALFGAGGEAAAQYASGQDMQLGDVLLEGLAEFTTAPVEVGGMALAKGREMRAKAKDAEARKTMFAELSGQAVNSKLRARMPDRFREFVSKATENGPVENVFVPAEDFVQYFQNAGIDPMALVDELDGVTRDDLDAALAGGGDLKIPTATYAAKIAGTEHDAFLMENMRFDPADMTAREAAEFNAKADDIMAEMWAEAEDIRQDEERWRAVEEKIHDTVVSQMRAAGLSTERAMAEVQPIVAFYRTRAARMGLTTEEYLDRHPLPGIQGAIPQGMQFKNVDDLNRTLAEARNRRAPAQDKRIGLLEFISDYGGVNDVGGELKALDAETIKRPGKSTLKLARDFNAGQGQMFGSGDGKRFGADDVARAAIEAGYMADSPIVAEYRASIENGTPAPDLTRAFWDAVAAERRGEKQVSEQDAAPVDDRYLDEIEGYLNRLGLDLNNTDDEIRAAIEKDQAAPDRMYGQSGEILTDSAAFKAWFGASKVVDADGKPLVVYHGAPDVRGILAEGFKPSPSRGSAFFFSDSSAVANTYADDRRALDYQNAEANVIPLYLSIQNPMVIDAGGAKWRDTERYVQEAKDAGHDGLIIKNSRDEYNNTKDGGRASTVYVTFEPSQAKSAMTQNLRSRIDRMDIGGGPNRGTFDPNDARILYQGGDTLNTLLSGARERIAQRNAMADDIAAAGKPVLMSNGSQRVLVGPNTIAGEKPFRVTYMGADGKPNGHVEAATLRDAAVRAMEDGFSPDRTLFQNDSGPRGAIQFMADGSSIIRLFETANLSTLQHEMGHLFLTMLQKDGAAGDQSAVAELETVKSWWRGNAAAVAADANRARGVRAKGEYRQDGETPEDIDAQITAIVGSAQDSADWIDALSALDADTFKKVSDLSDRAERLRQEASRLRSAERAARRALVPSSDELLAGYASPQDVPAKVADWVRRNSAILTSDATDAVRWGRIENTLNDPRLPEGLVAIYRAVDGDEIREGDWVTLDRAYAEAHLEKNLGGRGRIVEMRVDGRDVLEGPTGNAEELFYAPREFSGPVQRSYFQSGQPDFTDGNVTVTAEDVIRAIDTGTSGDTLKDFLIDVGMQEQFARGYEAYLMEGKAPSADLQSVFAKLRSWMISVYKTLRGLNVQMSDDIRGVFDRMLATDEEIAKAKAASGADRQVFTTAEQMGLTQEEFDRFLKLKTQAEDDATARLQAEAMEPIRREEEKAYKAEKARVTEEVTRRVNAMPVFRALEWLGNRRWLGDNQPDTLPDMRMSKEILTDRYGDGVLKTLPRGMQTVYTVEGGMDPDNVAGWFGFDSGDQMIRALERAPKRGEAIKAEVEAEMFRLHGDPLKDGEIERRALDAVHNDKRAQVIAAELKAVADVAGVAVPLTAKDARASARMTLARMKTRDAISANRFLSAERKAGEEAARLGAMLAREKLWADAAKRKIAQKAKAVLRDEGTVGAVAGQIDRANASTGNYNETAQKFIDAKRRQLMNHALYSEARAVAAEVEKAERFIARLNKSSMREQIAGAGRRDNAQIDYLSAIDEILARYDFRRLSGKAEDRRGALLAYVQKMTAAGRANELAIPAKVLADATLKPYKTLSVEELRGVIDSLKNLQHSALRWNAFLSEQRDKVFSEAKEAVVQAITDNVGVKSAQWVKDTGPIQRGKDFIGGYIASIQHANSILRGLDGGADLGVTYQTLKADLDAAAYEERRMLKDATAKLEDLYSAYTADEQRQMAVKRHYPELGGSFSKWNLIVMGLNMGNAGNVARLTNPDARMKLTPAQMQIVANRLLDARDAAFINGVWKYFETFRPLVAERDRRVKGVEPKWVDPVPVVIGGVALDGGYFPIKYNMDHGGANPKIEAESVDDIMSRMMAGGYASAYTKDGHLQERVSNVKMSLSLDTSTIAKHVSEVIHDLTFAEPVVNSWRIITSPEVTQAFIDADLKAQHQHLKLWVQDTASGHVGASDGISRAIGALRSGFTFSKLALNLKTIMLQPLGLMQSSVVVGKGRMLRHASRMLKNPVRISDEVVARSKMMWERRDTFNKDVMDMVAQANTASPAGSKLADIRDDFIIPYGMAGIKATQFYFVDVPTWAAAYEKGLEQFGTEAKAVEYADLTVNRTQGSGIFGDRSGFERGTLSNSMRQSPWITLMTTLGSYFFAKLNLAVDRTRDFRRAPMTPQAAMSYAMDMMLLYAGEAVVLALISMIGDDDDDENPLAAVPMEAGKAFLAGLPVVRDAVGLLDGFQGGTYSSILNAFVKPIQQAKQGEIDKAAVKSVVDLSGMILRLPSTAINRFIDAGSRQANGEDVSPAEYLFGRPR